MIKILHGADFHLDSPYTGLPEVKAAKRRAEQRELMERIARLAVDENVDAVLLPGDLLDSGRSYYETAEVLLRAFEAIPAPVFIAPGNHDYYSSKSPWAILKFPDNVHIFTSSTPEKVALRGKNCNIWGAAFTGHISEPLLKAMPKMEGSRINIMALHGNIGDPGGRYNSIDEEDVVRTGLDYLALGHIHSYSGLQKAGNTFWAYPGCPEGRGFDETGEKGVIIAKVSKGKTTHKFVPLGKRKYEILKVDVSDADSVKKAVMAALPGGTKQDIYRIILTGEFEGHLDLGKLEEAVAHEFFHVTVRDNTRPRRNIWAEAEEDTLRGLFLRKMRVRYEAADDKEKVVLAIRYALAAMEHGEEWRF